jgi:hypothetical protein
MKKFIVFPALLFFVTFFWTSCNNSSKDTAKSDVSDSTKRIAITERIEYPVFITDPWKRDDGKWWCENIETSKRSAFVKTLFDEVLSGKMKAYDIDTYKPLTIAEIQEICNPSDNLYFDLNRVHKLKFVEEWSLNESNHSIEKKVMGVAPMLTTSFGDSTDLTGPLALFWIIFDKDFAKKQSGI